jgi:hypothetical protein
MDATCGMLGRSPDFMNVVLTGCSIMRLAKSGFIPQTTSSVCGR